MIGGAEEVRDERPFSEKTYGLLSLQCRKKSLDLNSFNEGFLLNVLTYHFFC